MGPYKIHTLDYTMQNGHLKRDTKAFLMRITHLLGAASLPKNPDHAATSGIARATLEIGRMQRQQGHTVRIVAVQERHWQSAWRGVQLFSRKPIRAARLRLGKRMVDFSTHAAFIRFCLHHKSDVVHGHLYSYLRFIPASCRVVHFHGDPLYPGGANEGLDYTPKDFTTIARHSDAQIAVSTYVAGQLRQGMPVGANIHVVPNGVDVERFGREADEEEGRTLRERLGITEQAVVLLFAGAVTVEKGLLHLVQTFKQLDRASLPCLHLVVAGAVDLWGKGHIPQHQRDYEARILHEVRGAQRIHFLGRVSANEMPVVYAASDIVIMPSVWPEGFGLVALEALASGRPVIVSRIAGLIDFVDSSTGRLVTPGSERELADAITDLATNERLRQELGQNGRRLTRTYSWHSTADHIETIYFEQLRRGKTTHADTLKRGAP